MTQVYTLKKIQDALTNIDVVQVIEEAFKAYSNGQLVVQNCGHLDFKNPPGNATLNYGYLKKWPYYLVNIASEFPGNSKLNQPVLSGLVTLFDRSNGSLIAVFLDEGHLTAARAAAAGAVAAKHMAPSKITRIGIFGTGVQARMQLDYLRRVTDCREVLVWGRSETGVTRFIEDMTPLGFSISMARDESEIPEQCNLIVTTTSSAMPLITADMIRPGTHITAVGAVTPQKIELAPLILKDADIVVVDSLSESGKRGEVYHAVQTGLLKKTAALELGKLLSKNQKIRQSDKQISVADLTGLAIQDMALVEAVHHQLTS